MSHYAKVNNGLVEQVIVAEADFFDTFVDSSPGQWIQTSYNTHANQHPDNTPLRGNFAGEGYIYDRVNDVFYPPQPFKSWMLNKTTWTWEAPVPLPANADTVTYKWNEETTSWDEVTE
jgi:hypothetical protein